MLNIRSSIVAALCGLCMAATSMADELMIFPNADQAPEQQEQDKFACYSWAKDESDFDPMAPPTATKAPPQEGAKKAVSEGDWSAARRLAKLWEEILAAPKEVLRQVWRSAACGARIKSAKNSSNASSGNRNSSASMRRIAIVTIVHMPPVWKVRITPFANGKGD